MGEKVNKQWDSGLDSIRRSGIGQTQRGKVKSLLTMGWSSRSQSYWRRGRSKFSRDKVDDMLINTILMLIALDMWIGGGETKQTVNHWLSLVSKNHKQNTDRLNPKHKWLESMIMISQRIRDIDAMRKEDHQICSSKKCAIWPLYNEAPNRPTRCSQCDDDTLDPANVIFFLFWIENFIRQRMWSDYSEYGTSHPMPSNKDLNPL